VDVDEIQEQARQMRKAARSVDNFVSQNEDLLRQAAEQLHTDLASLYQALNALDAVAEKLRLDVISV
jgi:hypothetical protein